MNTGNYKGTVKTIEQASCDAFKLVFSSRLDSVHPGQFVSILCPNKTLRRPFSVADFNDKTKDITIIFKLKGDGTQYLKNLKIGDTVDYIAPLGKGFEILNKNSLLVGAGIGVAPMFYLKNILIKKNIKNYLISGFKNNSEVIQGSDENVIGGSVLDNIEQIIKEKNIELIYSCGPKIVLQKLSEISKKHNIKSQLAMEKVMACGIGVCRGCVIKIKKDEEIKIASICKDGPVFWGDEIIWE